MSLVRIDENLLPLALSYMFVEDRGHSMVLEMFEGTMPTKSELEAADIYLADGSGWMSVTKQEVFLAQYTLVRRTLFTDFSKNIAPIDTTKLEFDFQARDVDDFNVINEDYNQSNSGTVTWFMLRSVDSSNTTSQYLFTGSISDLGQGGDMEMSRRTLTPSDAVRPSNVIIDLGQLSGT